MPGPETIDRKLIACRNATLREIAILILQAENQTDSHAIGYALHQVYLEVYSLIDQDALNGQPVTRASPVNRKPQRPRQITKEEEPEP